MEKISLKTIYEVQFDTEQLIIDSTNNINKSLTVSQRIFEVTIGSMQGGNAQQMADGTLFSTTQTIRNKYTNDVYSNALYDIVGEIETQTNLTRRTIVAILKAIKEEKFLMIRKNPEEFISSCSRLINEVKSKLIINNIVYRKIEDSYDAKTVFTNDKSALRSSDQLSKHVYDFLTTDSAIEAEFAKALDTSTEVIVYAKLPKSFYISTPVAKYSPDWAIVFDKEKVRHIYFVAETKGSESDLQIRPMEALKIHCAEQHFEAIGEGQVKFSMVSTYAKLLEIVKVIK